MPDDEEEAGVEAVEPGVVLGLFMLFRPGGVIMTYAIFDTTQRLEVIPTLVTLPFV